ncbi:MAG: HD-GYP domain-containing protein [Desulfovibrio sp.]|jgi:HD-GYP domain-containing protein (c-di-GMP phosphodiesterase class II)|nr:HD-GYP domain-containing protein [Desulfovibrio sp.]
MQHDAAAAGIATNDEKLFPRANRAAYVDILHTGIDGMRSKLSKQVSSEDLPQFGESRRHFFTSEQVPGSTAHGIRDEIPLAVRVYDSMLSAVRGVMDSAGTGKLRMDNVDDAVSGAIQSLERNPDALLCIPRIRRRDNYIHTHCVNVSVLLAAFALRSGGDEKQAIAGALAGLLHDLGMALLPVALLTAKRKLSDTENALVKRHPMLGCEIMSAGGNAYDETVKAALEHHERYNGSGYPRGLSGESISEIGHITGIADTYDALSSRRPYKDALYPHRTLGVMYQMRKKQFHPVILEQFVRLVGIYPVGSVVELQDGYRGVVTGSNYANPILPVVTLALDPDGHSMCLHECDLAKDGVAGIARCLPPETSGVDPRMVLGIPA